MEAAVRRLRAAHSRNSPRNSSAACAASCRRTGATRGAMRRRKLRGRRREPSRRARPRRWRSKRSRPLMPELIGGSADLAGSNITIWKASKAVDAHDAARQLHPLRRARIRHGGDHEWPRAARRLHSVRRHVPGVLRLRAQRGAHGALMKQRRRSSCTRTTRSAWARTARRTSRSSSWRACASSRTCDVWRPCDAVETAVAWARGDRAHGRPDGLVFSRQNLPRTAAHDAADRDDRARRLRAARQRGRAGSAIAHRDRVGSRARDARRADELRQEGVPRARRLDAVHERVRSRRTQPIATSVLPQGVPRVRDRSGRDATSGASTSASTARVIGIDTFRRVGAGRSAVQAFRLHRRARRRGGRVAAAQHCLRHASIA